MKITSRKKLRNLHCDVIVSAHKRDHRILKEVAIFGFSQAIIPRVQPDYIFYRIKTPIYVTSGSVKRHWLNVTIFGCQEVLRNTNTTLSQVL